MLVDICYKYLMVVVKFVIFYLVLLISVLDKLIKWICYNNVLFYKLEII